MAYEKTGRPPGRPRKDGLPKVNENPDGTPKPRAHRAHAKPAVVPGHPANTQPGTPKPGPFPICIECWPEGWSKDWTTAACQHGIWARPWVP